MSQEPLIPAAGPDLVSSVRALAGRIEVLEARIARLEDDRETLEAAFPPLPPAVSEALDEMSTSGPLSLAGRTLIALGGAYLLRAATASGWLPPAAGTGLGLLYAAAWTLEADRAARRGRGISASLAAATGALLAYPLLWEASTRFEAFPARAALAGAFAFLLMAGTVAARRGRPAFAWLHLLPAIVLAFALLLHIHDVLGVLAALAALHAAAEAASARFGWHGMRWATGAAAALVAVSVLAVASPEASVAAVAILAVAICSGGILRSLRRAPDTFDAVAVAAAFGLGIAAVAALPPALRWWAGLAALALAAASYRAAARHGSAPRSAHALALAATGLAVAATSALLPAEPRVMAWSAAGLLAAWWSPRDRVFRLPAAAYLAAALGSGGALACAVRGLAGIGDPGRLSAAGAFAAGAAVAASLLGGSRDSRPFSLGRAILGGLGFAALATSAWPTAELAGAGGTAALALAAATLTLAARGRVGAPRGLAWMLLGMGAMRLLLVDLRDGRPLTLFVGLVSYGGALLAAQASRARADARARS